MPNQLALATTNTLRNGDLEQIVALLKEQTDIRYDVVVTAAAISYDQGMVAIDGGALRINDDGIDPATAFLRPTLVCERQIGERLGIPTRYMATMRSDAVASYERAMEQVREGVVPSIRLDEAAALLDHNVNHWLRRDPNRKFLIRGFRTDDPDSEGIARAFLSDRFEMIDHLDVLMAALDGVRQSGAKVTIDGCDLSENRMQVRMSAPEVQTLAPLWLKGYRSPFEEDGAGGTLRRVVDRGPRDLVGKPIVYAGLAISNSETGGGAFVIAPQVIVQWCKNGATMRAPALREVHVGGKLEEGVVRWSADTQRKGLELVAARARDAVATYLDVDYLKEIVARIEEKAGAVIAEPTKVVERVAKTFGFSQAEQDTILSAFISSGQITAGGVMHAVTAAAQTVEDPDRAAELEASAIGVLEFAAR